MLYMKIDDVSKVLDLSPSTIKKYYLLIEQQGYRFKRNQQGHVLFVDQDVQMFKKLIQLKNEPGFTLSKAVDQVMSTITDMTVITDDVITDMTDMMVMTENVNAIKEIVISQQNQINSLVKMQEESNKRIESGISKRDETLTQSLKETLEVKKMLIKFQEKQDKKKWWNFF